MDDEDREALLVLCAVLLLVIVLPLLILETPWLLALAMLLWAWYWWQTGTNPVSSTLETVRGERESVSDTVDSATVEDPITALRERYASGEIGDEEFERRLDRLLSTEPGELRRERSQVYEQ